MNTKILLVVLTMMCILNGCGKSVPVYFDQEPESESEISQTEQDVIPEETETEAEDAYVYICGAVNTPGVYAVKSDSRVFEVINLAGGLREDACADTVNQAEIVTDGQMLRIPTVEEVKENPSTTSATAGENEQDDKVNLNTASADVLMTLPGIGQSKAESIITYREENGGFKSIEDIKNITGIKDGVYTKIKDLITVN